MLAMYCPIKAEQKTDADYIGKVKGDIAKAATLKQEKKYDIDAWTFITPRKLSDDVIARMRALGEKFGIRVSHQESTFLANELYRRSHLLKGFPSLQQLDLSEKIDQVLEILKSKREAPPGEPKEEPHEKPLICDEAGNARFHELVGGVPTQEAKSELKAMAFRTTDPILEINAILALLRWFDPADDDRGQLLGFAERGAQRAMRCGMTNPEAVFRAYKAELLRWDFNTGFIEAYFSHIADILVPFATTPLEQRQQRLTRLRELEEGWKAEVGRAMDLIKESRDHETVAGVLVTIGTSIGQLAHMHRMIGDKPAADHHLAKCKDLLMAAKDVYGAAGDELGATNAVFNLANQIRWHDGKDEALNLVKSAIPIAGKHGDLLLLQKAKWLQQTLETGVIPDYAAGERRIWTAKR